MAKTIHNPTPTLHQAVQTRGEMGQWSGWDEAFSGGEHADPSPLKWEDCYNLIEDEELILEGALLKEKIVEIFLTNKEDKQ